MEAALKLFKTATGRRTVLSFSGAYHGMTHGALALTGNLSAKQEVAGLMPDVHFLPYPYSYRCPFGLGAAGAQTSLEYISEPDAVLLSKAIGGGYPLSVLLYHEKYDRWQAGAHAGTFRGNQMAMVAGAAVMEVLLEQDLVATVRDKGAYLQAALTHLAQTYPEIGDVRGRGLMWGLEIVDPRSEPDPRLGSRPADGARARAIQQACLAHGLILETGGRHGAVLRLLPPLIISFAELSEVVSTLELALIATAA